MPGTLRCIARRPPPRWAALLAAACMLCPFGGLGGCFVHLPADRDRAARPVVAVPDGAWPRWDEAALDRVRLTLEDRPIDRDIDWSAAGGPQLTAAFQGRVLSSREAIVRMWLGPAGRPANRSEFLGDLLNGFESNAEVLTAAAFGTERERRQTEFRWAREQTVGGPGFPPGEPCLCGLDAVDLDRRQLSNGLAVRLPDETPDKPRGILIHHPSLMGNEYERAVVNVLKSRGWVVLSVVTRKSIAAPIGEERLAKAVSLERRLAALRSKEPRTSGGLTADLITPPTPERAAIERELAEVTRERWVVSDASSADRAGREIAERIDAGLAEGAVATRASLDALLTIRPELVGLPVSMIGFSAGSLAATTIAASLTDRLSCLVLVGPACNLAAAGRRSSLFNGGITLVGPDGAKVGEPLGQAVEEAYLWYSKLDPFHTAPSLARTPVLVVRGWFDGWVPAELCDDLIDRLGTPDRLAVPGGHQVLFYLLPTQAPWIADWLDEHTPASGGYARRSAP